MKKLITIIVLVMLSVPAFCANPSFQSFSQTWFTTNGLTLGFQPNIPVTKLTIGDASLDFAQAPFQIRATDSSGNGFKLWGAGATPTFSLYTNLFQYTNTTAVTGLTGDSSGNMTGSGTATFGTFSGSGLLLTGIPESAFSFTDITTANVSTTKHGLAPKLPNDATKYLDGTGVYSTPSGSGSASTNTMISISTNIVLNTVYSNNFGGSLLVNVPMTYTVAAVNGNADLTLVVLGFTNYTVGASTAIGVTIPMTYQGIVSGAVPPGSGFYVTNNSSGIGNSATMNGAVWSYATNIVGVNISASQITSGTIATARLGSGTANNTTVLYGDNVFRAPSGGGGTNMTPVALTISGTNVAVVGTLPTGAIGPILYNLTATTNVFLQVPSGTPVDGQSMIVTLSMDAVGTWNYLHDTNSAGGYKGGIDLALPLPNSTNALATDVIGYRYNSAKNKWFVTSHVRGY